jgi:purine-binding chemotaxis protein CheW
MSADLPEELLDIESELFGDEEEEGGEEPEVERERYILFDLGGETYAAPVLSVRQVVETVARTRVPRTAPAIDGIMDLRGEITAVINPWVHLSIPREPRDWDDQYVVVFTVREGEQPIGIRIDAVLGVEGFPVDDVTEPEAGANPLVDAVVARERDGEVVEEIPVLDPQAVVDASREPDRVA